MKYLLAVVVALLVWMIPSALFAEEPKGTCDSIRYGLRFSAIANQHPDWMGRKMPDEEIASLWQLACRAVLSEDPSLETILKVNGLTKKTVRLVRGRATDFLFELVAQAWKPVDEVAALEQVRLYPMPSSGTSLPTPRR